MAIAKSDLSLIDQLCKEQLTLDQFVDATKFTANEQQLRYLLYLTEGQVDNSNDNKAFRILSTVLPHKLTIEEEAAIFGDLLLEPWHHEHEEIVTSFQVLYSTYSGSVETLMKAFLNIPKYISSITERKESYQKKIIYALARQSNSAKIDSLQAILKMELTSDMHKLIQDQLSKLQL